MDREALRRPLDVAALRDGLAEPWRQIDVVAETGSTNADLLARAASGADVDAEVLIAEHQSAGRGRYGRSWSAAPRAQIAMSVGVRVADTPTTAWGWLPLAAGVAVVDAVAALLEATGIEAGLKWPNDVLAGGGKLAGILAEAAPPVVAIGIGLNVAAAPEEIADATSLLDLGVKAPDRDLLVRRLLHELGVRIGQWRRGDPQLPADYRARSLTVGSRVRAELPGGREVVGTARDVDEQGRLCIDDHGQTVAVSAGDVVHVRAGA